MSTFANPQDRAQIQQRLERLKSDSPRRWGKMSPHQMVCHLSDAFRMASGERSAKPVDNIVSRNLIRWVALHTNITWPHGAKTVPEADQESGGTTPQDWVRDHTQLLEYMQAFGKRPLTAKHPMFGQLKASEWEVWAYRHCDHHLRQFGM
ncbi:MAG: DUF1569 domain-containing protein [Acidobacteriota bacterium]